jgi:hypothetical protein
MGKIDHIYCQAEDQETYNHWTNAITNNGMYYK